MPEPLDLGCFSVSLAVADLDASLAFDQKLGFQVLGDQQALPEAAGPGRGRQ